MRNQTDRYQREHGAQFKQIRSAAPIVPVGNSAVSLCLSLEEEEEFLMINSWQREDPDSGRRGAAEDPLTLEQLLWVETIHALSDTAPCAEVPVPALRLKLSDEGVASAEDLLDGPSELGAGVPPDEAPRLASLAFLRQYATRAVLQEELLPWLLPNGGTFRVFSVELTTCEGGSPLKSLRPPKPRSLDDLFSESPDFRKFRWDLASRAFAAPRNAFSFCLWRGRREFSRGQRGRSADEVRPHLGDPSRGANRILAGLPLPTGPRPLLGVTGAKARRKQQSTRSLNRRAQPKHRPVRAAAVLPAHLLLEYSQVRCGPIHSMSFLSRSEYDRGVNTFSPEGRLFQVEYAIEAIKLGSTAIGVCTKEGVILVVEKRVTSPLVDPSSIEKLLEIDCHMGCAMSGLTADARTLVDHARVEAQAHWFTYDERMPIESNVNAIADMALDFSDSDKKKKTMSRPFGVALLVAGVDPWDGPVLFNTDPSGTFTKYAACAIGSAQEGATSMLQEQYNKDMTLKEAEILALTTLRQVMEEKLSKVNIEVGVVPTSTGKFRCYNAEELEDVISRLPAPTVPTLQTAAAAPGRGDLSYGP
eukprot:s2710_g10.t5